MQPITSVKQSLEISEMCVRTFVCLAFQCAEHNDGLCHINSFGKVIMHVQAHYTSHLSDMTSQLRIAAMFAAAHLPAMFHTGRMPATSELYLLIKLHSNGPFVVAHKPTSKSNAHDSPVVVARYKNSALKSSILLKNPFPQTTEGNDAVLNVANVSPAHNFATPPCCFCILWGILTFVWPPVALCSYHVL
jgi:hypothetical protein